MSQKTGNRSVAFHRTQNGEPRVLYMHPEKLIAWLLRALVALLLFIWHSNTGENGRKLDRIDRKIDAAVAEFRIDHDITTRNSERLNEYDRRLRNLEMSRERRNLEPASIAEKRP